MPSALALVVLALAGCSGEDPAPAPRPPVPPGNGVITGTVTLSGKVSEMREIPNSSCHGGGANVREETIVSDAAGRLANVVVYLKDGPPVSVPAKPVLLDQVGCRYVPHVVAVRTGQTLRVKSSDPTLHNVHGQSNANPAFNFGMTGAGQTRDLTFARPETFKVTCDVHPWMRAYVAVFDHPLFAVTGEGGTFEIRNVPPGAYTLVAWHERLGTREQQVTVPPEGGDDAPVGAGFTYGTAAK